MKKTAVILFLIVAANLDMWPQMTLRDCLLYAREHSHANVISRLDVRKAEIDRNLSASDMMPYLGFSTSANLSFGRNIDPETNTYDNRKSLSTGFGLSLSLPLFDGLVAVNHLKAAKVAVRRQDAQSRIEEDEISLNVIRAFYNVSYCRAMTDQMSSQLRRDSADLAATRKSMEVGTKSGADVAEFEAIVAADSYALVNQRNLLKKAVLDLKGYMGMNPSEDSISLVESDELFLSDTGRAHPKIEEARYALEQSRFSLRAAKGMFSPKISLEAGVSTSYYRMEGIESVTPGFREQWRNNMGQYVGVSFSLPLFDGLASANKLKRARLEMEQALQRKEMVDYELKKATAEAQLDVDAAIAELDAADRRLKAEQTAFKAARRKYELGMISPVELYTSSAKLAEAMANLEGKRIQRIIARIILRYCQGATFID